MLALMFENPRPSSTDSIGLTVHVDMFLNMIDYDAFLFFPYIERRSLCSILPAAGEASCQTGKLSFRRY